MPFAYSCWGNTWKEVVLLLLFLIRVPQTRHGTTVSFGFFQHSQSPHSVPGPVLVLVGEGVAKVNVGTITWGSVP